MFSLDKHPVATLSRVITRHRVRSPPWGQCAGGTVESLHRPLLASSAPSRCQGLSHLQVDTVLPRPICACPTCNATKSDHIHTRKKVGPVYLIVSCKHCCGAYLVPPCARVHRIRFPWNDMPCFQRPSPSGTSAPFTHTRQPPSCVVPKWSPKSSVPQRLWPQFLSLLPSLSTALKPPPSNSILDGSIVAPTSPSRPVSSTNAAIASN